MDTTKLGQVAAVLMDRLAEDADGIQDETELGEVMILAEVRGNDGADGWTSIAFQCSDSRLWVQRGMLHAALVDDRVFGSTVGPEEDDDE